MSSKNRDGKPTKFQLDALKALGADLKGIKKYRDAENALKRLRKAKKTNKKAPAKKPVCAVKKAIAKKDAADKSITVKAKKPSVGKCITVKPSACKKPIKGTDEVRIKLPSCKCNDGADCRHLTVDVSVIHDAIFSSDQMKNIDKLAKFCSNAIVSLCNDYAKMNGLFEKPACTCKKHGQKKLPVKKTAKKPVAKKSKR